MDVKRFCESSFGCGQDETVRLWKQIVELPNQDYFQAFVYPEGCGDVDVARKVSRDAFLSRVCEFLPGMERISEALNPIIGDKTSALRELFPGASFCTTAYCGVSYLTWDAKTGFLPPNYSRHALAFAADTLACEGDMRNLGVTVAHELAHSCHYNAANLTFREISDISLCGLMWIEGVATYLAMRVNPEYVARMRSGTPSEYSAGVGRFAAEFLEISGNKCSGEEELIRWFSKNAAGKLPPKTAYYLGRCAVEDLSAAHGLDAIMCWSLEKAESEVVSWLKSAAT